MWPQQRVGTGDPSCTAAVAMTAFPPLVREPTRCFPPMRILFSTPWVKLNRPALKGYHNIRDPIRNSSIVPIDHDLRKGNVENARVLQGYRSRALVVGQIPPTRIFLWFFFLFLDFDSVVMSLSGDVAHVAPPATSKLKTTVAARSSSIVVG